MKIILQIVLLFLIFNNVAYSSNSDTLKTAKHFIKPTLYFNAFGAGKQYLKKAKTKEYQFSQSNIGGFFPIITNINYSKKLVQSTFQLIGFGNILTTKPRFSLLEENHRLVRLNLGCNGIYTNGKNTFLVTLSPFKAQDKSSIKTSTWRMSWMVIYNRTVNENFSYRIGYVRSFVLDGNPNLPVVGFRIGKYEGFHLNAQFPRNVTLNIPLTSKIKLLIYGKAIGSIYELRDVEIAGNTINKAVFRRNDLQRGLELNYKNNNNFNFFVGIGRTNGKISFGYKEKFNFSKNAVNVASGELTQARFINFGMSYSFGSAKRNFNNQTMLDAMQLNQQAANSDLNTNPNFVAPTVAPAEIKLQNVQLKDIQDLIDVDDLN